MDARTEPSVEELRRESERTRAALAGTVVELREKVSDTASELKTLVSPAHIKREIRTYVRDERENLVQSLERRARDNPLQAVAVGAALAYPAWGLLRAIPTPLMLIGAGLWLTSSRGKRSTKDMQAAATGALEHGTAKVSEFVAGARSDLAAGAEKARDSLNSMGDAVSSNLETLADRARARAHDIQNSIVSKASTVAGSATSAFDSATAQASSIGEAAERTASDLAGAASDAKNRAVGIAATSRNAVMDFVEQNPLLVAGIGVAIGGFIAAAIPGSKTENRVLGGSSDMLKDKAREAAAQGVEKAKGMASDVVGDAAAAAAREGIDAAGVKKAIDSVVGGVKSVVDRGVQTALAGVAPANTDPQSFQQNNNTPRSQS